MTVGDRPKVLVVGAGPSGLVLALSLLRNHVNVRIIEKCTEQRIGQRGAAIMPRSMELFHTLGVAHKVLERCMPTPPVRMYDLRGGLTPIKSFDMAPTVDPTPDSPYFNIVCLGQDSLEQILRDEIAQYGVHVELGTELVSFQQELTHVDVTILKDGVEEQTSYPWVGGTDGARGVVRKLLGATFLGEMSNVDNIIVGDIIVEGLDKRFWHMWGDSATTLVSLRPTETPQLFNFIFAGEGVDHHELVNDYEKLRRTFQEAIGVTKGKVKLHDVVWMSTHRPNIRMVNRMGQGRVFLAGDSAHIHSFTGGQGMNTGIQDSFNLGWKLALVEQQLAPISLLQSYAEERLPVIAEMLSQTTTLLNKSFKRKENPGAWKREGGLLQLGVNYRWSSLVIDEQRRDDLDSDDEDADSYGSKSEGLKAGDRAPDAPGLIDLKTSTTSRPTRLFDVFGSSCHTVLIFSNRSRHCASTISALQAYSQGLVKSAIVLKRGQRAPSSADDTEFVLEDTFGHAYATYSFTEGCNVAIVRPDGIIGAIVKGADGVVDCLGGIFGWRDPGIW